METSRKNHCFFEKITQNPGCILPPDCKNAETAGVFLQLRWTVLRGYMTMYSNQKDTFSLFSISIYRFCSYFGNNILFSVLCSLNFGRFVQKNPFFERIVN